MIDILVLENEIEIQNLLRDSFEEADIYAEFVHSGEEAIEMIERSIQSQWKLFLINLGLPGISGFDVIKVIRNKWPRAIVLVMSGYIDKKFKHWAIDLGVSEYLEKPSALMPNILIPKINSYLA